MVQYEGRNFESEEMYQEWLKSKQIDICPPKSTEQKLEKENNQLWDTVNFLLKADGYIPSESEV